MADTRRESYWGGKARRDQAFAVLIGLGCLAGSMYMNHSMNSMRRQNNLVRETPASEKSLRSLAVTFPRLTLGGFRGLVSTVLWIKAEDDKNERRWLELETKYDIIGALQPYFVSVYVYHAWNQAYNLSAQWQDQDSKYKWVLDGLSYLYKGEDYNPGVPDLLLEEGHLYYLKLGGAFERVFYRQHWRDDIARLHDLNDAGPAKNDAALALQHVREIVNRRDPKDEKTHYFNIQELRNPQDKSNPAVGWGIQITDPHDPDDTRDKTDRRTRYLPPGFNLFKGRSDGKKAVEPVEFRYGVSPFYFAYMEYMRCIDSGVAKNTGNSVMSSQPAMCLRLWTRDDCYSIGKCMADLFGVNPDTETLTNPIKLQIKYAEMHDNARNIQMIAPRAIELFDRHLGNFPNDIYIHTKHKYETNAILASSKAEIKLFETLIDWHMNQRKLNDKLRADFGEARRLYDAAYAATVEWVNIMFPPPKIGDPPNPDRVDFERYANALDDRRRGIDSLVKTLNDNPQAQIIALDWLNDIEGQVNAVVEK